MIPYEKSDSNNGIMIVEVIMHIHYVFWKLTC